MLDLMVVPVVAALAILAIHAYLGLHVIHRGVIFVDLAFAQIAALGATVWQVLGSGHGEGIGSFLFAYGFTLVGALIFSFTRMRRSLVPQEAIIGITYVVASAAVILVAGFTAEGAETIKETLTGTLIWITWPAVLRICLAYAVLGAFYWVFRRPMLAASFRPERAGNARFWDFVFYASFGLVITFSVAVAGVLMVFSCLVIPAVIAFLFTDHFSRALVLAWISGAVAIILGTVVSFVLDWATGPTLVCAFGVVLVIAGLVRVVTGVRPEGPVRVVALEGSRPDAGS